MSEAFFSVYQTEKDHKKWSKKMEYVDANDDIPSHKKEDLKNALKTLRSFLGNGFLKNAWGSHPIVQIVHGFGDELIQFTDTLERLSQMDSNLDYLVRKKLIPNKPCWDEGRHFIRIANSLINAGFNVEFLEEQSRVRTPDIKVLNPNSSETFYVEVSRVSESESRTLISDNYDSLTNKFRNQLPVLPYSCKQIQVLNDVEMRNIHEQIELTKSRVLSEGNLITYEDNSIMFAIAPPKRKNELLDWAGEHNNGQLELRSLDQDFDDTKRIRDYKIEHKADQIPEGKVGILNLIVHPLYFWVIDPNETVEIFHEKFAKTPQLYGVILQSHVGQTVSEAGVCSEGHFYSRKMLTTNLCRDLLFVKNQHFSGRLSAETEDMIYASFQA